MSSNKSLNIMHNYLNSIKTDKESVEIDHKSGRIHIKNKDSYLTAGADCFFSVVQKEEPEPLPSNYYKDINKACRAGVDTIGQSDPLKIMLEIFPDSSAEQLDHLLRVWGENKDKKTLMTDEQRAAIDKAIRDVPNKIMPEKYEKLPPMPALHLNRQMNNWTNYFIKNREARKARITEEQRAAIDKHNLEMKERHEKSTALYTELDPNKRFANHINKYNETSEVKLYVYNDTDEEN